MVYLSLGILIQACLSIEKIMSKFLSSDGLDARQDNLVSWDLGVCCRGMNKGDKGIYIYREKIK